MAKERRYIFPDNQPVPFTVFFPRSTGRAPMSFKVHSFEEVESCSQQAYYHGFCGYNAKAGKKRSKRA